jgi:hypothetical protein
MMAMSYYETSCNSTSPLLATFGSRGVCMPAQRFGSHQNFRGVKNHQFSTPHSFLLSRFKFHFVMQTGTTTFSVLLCLVLYHYSCVLFLLTLLACAAIKAQCVFPRTVKASVAEYKTRQGLRDYLLCLSL